MGIQDHIPAELINKTRVLVVEDNLLNQKIAGHLVKSFGFACDTCSNGKQAVELLASAPFQLVLMDIQMPEMDGYEASKYIRENLKLDLPIIATSGNSSASEKNKCIESGMTDYISKPLKSEELFEVIAKYLFPDYVYTK